MCDVVRQAPDEGFAPADPLERSGAVFRVVEELTGCGPGEEFEWEPPDGYDAVYCRIDAVGDDVDEVQCRHPGTDWETLDGPVGTVFRIPVGSEVRLIAAETRRLLRR